METIAERLQSALESLNKAELKANRAPNSVQLLAVSKTKPVSDIVLAYEQGQRLFGENYVQEGVDKVEQLQELSDIQWHFIGPLQSNKTRLVASHFDWVQTLDRMKIAQRLNDQRSPFKTLNVLIQININSEPSKAGIELNELEDFAAQVSKLPNLTLRGLMAIPKAEQSEAELNQSFARMHEAFIGLQQSHSTIDTLSMGMSNDAQNAIMHGSTMVRLGTAIFGSR
jgi:pyridoxal phosphate enzyme (YggS family)